MFKLPVLGMLVDIHGKELVQFMFLSGNVQYNVPHWDWPYMIVGW